MESTCRQCGKRTTVLCGRADCWNTEANLAMEASRRKRHEVIEQQKRDAVKNFPQNFVAVTAWAERTGAQRFQDREVIRRMAKETVKAAEIYAAIARSL